MNVESFGSAFRPNRDRDAARDKDGRTGKAARDFESVCFFAFRLAARNSWDSEDSTPGASNYRMMGTHALAESVSAQGGIGIARMVLRHLPLTEDLGRNELNAGVRGEAKVFSIPPIRTLALFAFPKAAGTVKAF